MGLRHPVIGARAAAAARAVAVAAATTLALGLALGLAPRSAAAQPQPPLEPADQPAEPAPAGGEAGDTPECLDLVIPPPPATDTPAEAACRRLVGEHFEQMPEATCATRKAQLRMLPRIPEPCDRAAIILVAARIDARLDADAARKQLIADVAEAATLTIPLSAVEPAPTDTPGSQGSPGQATAVASGQPVSQAGGTVAYAGRTGVGQLLVTALSLNPFGIGSDLSARDFAWRSRFADVSLILPADLDGVSPTDPAEESKAFRFVGVRARINVFAGRNGRDAYDKVAGRVKAFVAKQEDLAKELASLLRTAPAPAACAEALSEKADSDIVRAACGKVPVLLYPEEAHRALDKEIDEVRTQLDRWYCALDLRGDFGNPAASDDGVDGTFVTAAVAAGFRLGDILSARGRAGAMMHFFDEDQVAAGEDRSGVSLDYGAGLEWQPGEGVELAVGVEGREAIGRKRDPRADDDFVDLHIGFTVPVATGKRVAVGLSLPLDDRHGAAMTIAGDWALLFSGIGGKR